MDQHWQALARESGVAAEHLGIGASAIGKANYAQTAYFGQALFALSVGIERSCKLVLVSNYALRHQGRFPDSKILRSYGHDLAKLLSRVDAISSQYENVESLVMSPIQEAVVDIVGTFAKNVTRYYNLEMLTREMPHTTEPAAAWFTKVTLPTLQQHVRPSSVDRVMANAKVVDAMLSGIANVRFYSETGELISDVFSASARTGLTELAQPWERMYVLRIARYLGRVLSEISFESYAARIELPHLATSSGCMKIPTAIFALEKRGRSTGAETRRSAARTSEPHMPNRTKSAIGFL